MTPTTEKRSGPAKAKTPSIPPKEVEHEVIPREISNLKSASATQTSTAGFLPSSRGRKIFGRWGRARRLNCVLMTRIPLSAWHFCYSRPVRVITAYLYFSCTRGPGLTTEQSPQQCVNERNKTNSSANELFWQESTKQLLDSLITNRQTLVDVPCTKKKLQNQICGRRSTNNTSIVSTASVLLFLKLNKTFFFDILIQKTLFLDIENKLLSGWPNRYFGWRRTTGQTALPWICA